MLDQLAEAIHRHRNLHDIWAKSLVPHLTLVAVDEPVEPADVLYDPMICFIADGAKRTIAGDRSWVTPRGMMLLNTVDLPTTAVFEKVPYRAAVMRLDGQVLADLMLELDDSGPRTPSFVGGQVTVPMTPELIDAVTRWVRLLDTPEDIRPLADRFESEILYRLLSGPIGPILRQWLHADFAAARVRSATSWICAHYTEPLSTDAIAEIARMSPATLHRHFKAATGMSPLKFQKHLRLREARRRLVAGDTTAAQVAEAVGYASVTQFNREYRRAYGLPPGQDAARLRLDLSAPTGLAARPIFRFTFLPRWRRPRAPRSLSN
jgi:AraC-like DNA-binding protein